MTSRVIAVNVIGFIPFAAIAMQTGERWYSSLERP